VESEPKLLVGNKNSQWEEGKKKQDWGGGEGRTNVIGIRRDEKEEFDLF